METRERTTGNIIELEEVSKKYQLGEVCVTAVDNISLGIAPGEFVSCWGHPAVAKPRSST